MGVFDDNPFVVRTPGAPAPGSPRPEGGIARGSFWTLYAEERGHTLEYVSGELEGRARRLSISDAEAGALKTGDDAAAMAVLTAHGVG